MFNPTLDMLTLTLGVAEFGIAKGTGFSGWRIIRVPARWRPLTEVDAAREPAEKLLQVSFGPAMNGTNQVPLELTIASRTKADHSLSLVFGVI